MIAVNKVKAACYTEIFRGITRTFRRKHGRVSEKTWTMSAQYMLNRGRERRGRPLPPNPVCGFPATRKGSDPLQKRRNVTITIPRGIVS